MVKNQTEFSEKHPKDKKEKVIKIREESNFQGELVIEDYPDLDKLYLRNVKKVDKLILKNLKNLTEFTIWDCCVNELIVEDCSQFKLNFKDNLLTNLEELKEKYNYLKTFLKEDVWLSISKEIQEMLVDKLNEDIKSKERKISDATTNKNPKTAEIILEVKKSLKSAKELKRMLEAKIEDLEKELSEKVALQQETKKELETQKNVTETLLKQLVEKTIEKEKASNENEANDLQKEINHLRQDLKESERKVTKLEVRLEDKQEEIVWMREKLGKVIDTPKFQTIQSTVISSKSINTYHIQYNVQYQQLETEIEKQISEPLTKLEVTEQDKKVINQTIIFWGVQELFFNYRKNTIDKLVNCYCRLANKTKITKKWTTGINSVMGITSKIVKSVPNGSVAETPLGIVGDTAVLTGIILEDKYLGKCIEEFKKIIEKDSKDLIFFDQSYDSLAKTIWNNNQPHQSLLSPVVNKIVETLNLVKEKPYPFSKDQDIYQVSNIRQEYFASLTSTELRSFLEKLDKNLVELYQSFEDQKKQLTDQDWFKTINQQTDLLQEQKVETQAQIQVNPN